MESVANTFVSAALLNRERQPFASASPWKGIVTSSKKSLSYRLLPPR
jgi:hypothetical protein